jgi:hypothetical protein
METLKSKADTCMQWLMTAVSTEQLKSAENGLEQLSEIPLFSLVLLQYLEPISPPLPRPVRRLAAILFRRCIVKKHWKASTITDVITGEKRPCHVISDSEKIEIRRRLPMLLADPDGSVRSLTAAALGSIGSIEWPSIWPGFVDGLKDLIDAPNRSQGTTDTSSSSSNDFISNWLKADGALRCLDEVLGSCSASDMPSVASALSPSLFSICSLSSTSSSSSSTFQQSIPLGSSVFICGMKERAFDCFIRIVEQLALSCDIDKKTKKTVNSLIGSIIAGPLLSAIGSSLATPGWYTQACQLKHSALCCLNTLLMNFSTVPLLKSSVDIVCVQVTEFAKIAAAKYVAVVVDDGEEEDPPSLTITSSSSSTQQSHQCLDTFAVINQGGENASGGGGGGGDGTTPLESILVSYVQFVAMMNMSTVKAANKAMYKNLPAAISVLLSCCQLAENQLQSWDSTPDAYVQDEGDDSFESTLRMEVQDALRSAFDVNLKLSKLTCDATTTLCAAFISAALGDVGALNDPRISAAHTMASPLFSSQRWKVAEGAIYALGSIAGEWIDFQTQSSSSHRQEPAVVTPDQFASQLSAILQSGGRGLMSDDKLNECAPYLLGRSLWCAARLATALPEAACGSLINWSVEGLTPSHPLPIRFAACVSLARLLKRAPQEIVEVHGVLIFERIALMMLPYVNTPSSSIGTSESSDSISYLVDLVAKAIEYAPRASGRCEPTISPLLLALWVQHGNNPVMCPQIARALHHLVLHDDITVSNAIAQRLLPVISNVLERAFTMQKQSSSISSSGTTSGTDEENFPSGLIEHTIGLLRTLVERSSDTHFETIKSISSSSPLMSLYSPLPSTLSPLLHLNASLLSITTDASLVSASTRLLGASIRIYGPSILEAVNPPLLGSCFGTLVQVDTHSDSAITPVGIVAIAIFRHLLTVLPIDAIDHMLSGLCTRIIHTRIPGTIERLIAAVAYAIVADRDPNCIILNKLASLPVTLPKLQGTKKKISNDPWSCAASITSPSRQLPGLVVWAKVVSDYHDLITRPQVRRLVSAAVSRILGHPQSFKMLMHVRVNGEQIESPDPSGKGGRGEGQVGGVGSISTRTRSGRAKAGKQILNTEVALPVRLLTKFIKAFFDDCNDSHGVEDEEEDEEDDEEGYDHDEEDGDDDEDEEAENEDGIIDDAVHDDEDDIERRGRKGNYKSPFVDASTLRGLVDYDDEEDDDDDNNNGSFGGVRLSDLLDRKGQNQQLAALLASGNDDYDDENGNDIDAIDDEERREEEDPLGLGDKDMINLSKDSLALLLREPTAAALASKEFLSSLATAATKGETTAKSLIEATMAQLTSSEKENLNIHMK